MLAIRGGKKVRETPLSIWPPKLTESENTRLLSVLSGGSNRNRLLIQKTEFEKSFSNYCGTQYAIAVNSGATALDLAIESLDLQSHSLVIASVYGHPSTVRFAAEKHKIYFLDIDESTLCISNDLVEKTIQEQNVSCIITTHVAGQIATIKNLQNICYKYNIPLIEDASHAHGATLKDTSRSGSFGTLACFSLHDTKPLAAGEGGIIVLNDAYLAKKIRIRHDIGRAFGPNPYDFVSLGGNYRLSELSATLANIRLKKLSEENEIRDNSVKYLRNMIPSHSPINLLPEYPSVLIHPHHFLPTRYTPEKCHGISKHRFILAMNAEGITCNPGWPTSLNRVPPINATLNDDEQSSYPVTEKFIKESVWFDHRLLLDKDGPEQILIALDKIQRLY